MKKLIFLLTFFSLFLTISAQEICDNAIDDDGDGLVDLNDLADCYCSDLTISSLIPNPSFEEMICCPTANAQLNCAVDWFQASAATTDYVHTCQGYLGNTSIPAVAPLPFADGEGGVGFRDGQMNIGAVYKEYVGACLTEVMEIGVTYRLDFFVGFQEDKPGSQDVTIGIFASANCADLPFGAGNSTIGCPTNVQAFSQLGQQQVSGNNEWVNVVFEFVADQAYENIVLGPGCASNPNFLQDPYFYVDRLTLAKLSAFNSAPVQTTGSICQNDLTLSVDSAPENTYQWYQDGIALLGETNATLTLTSLNNTAGSYQVFITSPDGCAISELYPLLIPPYYETISSTICANEFYLFDNDTLTETGTYEQLLLASDGCDSIVQLDLQVLGADYLLVQDTICAGTTYLLNGNELTQAGIYETVFVSQQGCDSLVRLELVEIGFGIGMELEESYILHLGEQINLAPTYYDANLNHFLWTDQSGTVLGNEIQLRNYQPVHSTLIYLEADNEHGCFIRDSIQIIVIPDHQIFVPNVFSPDGDGVNDFFRYYGGLSLSRVHRFAVFNRWGGLVYRMENLHELENFKGWDGQVAGQAAQVGVYVYMLEVEYLDGVRELLSGDVSLLR
jgi:gliding motility-associated-like protein